MHAEGPRSPDVELAKTAAYIHDPGEKMCYKWRHCVIHTEQLWQPPETTQLISIAAYNTTTTDYKSSVKASVSQNKLCQSTSKTSSAVFYVAVGT